MTTGSSVLACKYKGGVMIASDTLASYGSLARFMTVERLRIVTRSVVIGASGEYSDLQYIDETLSALARRDRCRDDGFGADAKAMWNFLTRAMYQRRSKFDPLWCGVVVAGPQFLGTVDMYGTSMECDFTANGYGMYLALPLLRAHWKPEMSRLEAKELLERCMRVLLFRDARTINKMQVATVAVDGAEISKPYELDTAGMWNSGELAIHDPK